MKTPIRLTVSALLCALPLCSLAAAPPGSCEAKREEVQQRLEQARAHNNSAQEAKLKIALLQIEQHCTDAGLQREREAEIKKLEARVERRKADLKEAEADGRRKKITRQQKKLDEAEAELQQARDALPK